MSPSSLTTPGQPPAAGQSSCPHVPQCPAADAPDHAAARAVACHAEQGWSLLCNGVVVFDDCGEILPDGTCAGARRPSVHRPRPTGRYGSGPGAHRRLRAA
jgi:hypothetical protein